MKASSACVEDYGSRVLSYVECSRREQGVVVAVVVVEMEIESGVCS